MSFFLQSNPVGRPSIARFSPRKFLTVVQVYDFGKEHGLNWLHPQETQWVMQYAAAKTHSVVGLVE